MVVIGAAVVVATTTASVVVEGNNVPVGAVDSELEQAEANNAPAKKTAASRRMALPLFTFVLVPDQKADKDNDAGSSNNDSG